MTIPLLVMIAGLVLLVWSADLFIEGAASTAKHFGVPSLLIGMLIVGFGTSAPEMVVSAMAALDGNPNLALGNALGSNIANTGLILGITALMAPIVVHSKIVRRELPLLFAISLISGLLFWNGELSRSESLLLLAGFLGVMTWSVFTGLRERDDALAAETDQELLVHSLSRGKAAFFLVAGLLLLLVSSRMLVWGAVTVAQALGISDLVIGLTVVAMGTSLPELAASVVAARKGEHDIAIGNVVGSNMFNLLAVVGIAGVIAPIPVLPAEILTRDWPVMIAMTLALFCMAYGFRGEGRLNRIEGGLLLLAFLAYNGWLLTAP